MVNVELLRKYWLVLLVAVLLGFFGYRLWPKQKDTRPALQPGVLGPSVERVAEEAPNAEEKPAPLPLEQAPPQAPNEKLTFEMREFLIAVPSDEQSAAPARTYTQDSPEVQAALAQLKIEIYGDAESHQATEAKAFLSHNELSFADHDTKDVNARERVRRLTGDGDQAVMVIDGQLLSDLSPEGIQKGLLEATKRRVLGENEQPRLPDNDSTLP